MIKKLLFISFLSLFCHASNADSGIFETYIFFNVNNYAGPGGFGTQYDGQSLGVDPATLTLDGGEVKTYKNGTCDVTGATLSYRVYEQGTAAPAYSVIGLNFGANLWECCGGGFGDQSWNINSLGIDLLAGTSAGKTYVVEVLWDYSVTGAGCSNTAEGPQSATFELSAAAPVEFSSFSAVNKNNQVNLNWSTSSEFNNDYFEIQRSQDSRTWESLDLVNGHGDSQVENNYHFVDKKPMDGINYYRLKQVDFNGDFEYSETTSVRIENGKPISFYPNPIKDNQIKILSAKPIENVTVKIVSLQGQEIFTNQLDLNNEVTSLELEVTPGMYLIIISDQHGEFISLEKILVQ